MQKTYKKAVIFNLTPSILRGVGRGVEVFPTTLQYAKHILSSRPTLLTTTDQDDNMADLEDDVELNLIELNCNCYKEDITFTTDLRDNEEYSDLLYICNKNTEFYLIRAL